MDKQCISYWTVTGILDRSLAPWRNQYYLPDDARKM